MNFEACSRLVSNDFLASKKPDDSKSTETPPKSTELGAFQIGYLPSNAGCKFGWAETTCPALTR